MFNAMLDTFKILGTIKGLSDESMITLCNDTLTQNIKEQKDSHTPLDQVLLRNLRAANTLIKRELSYRKPTPKGWIV